MTATDELRRMLDERGVEHEDDENVTRFFGPDGFEVVMQEDVDGRLDCLTPLYLTPEQAIAATLGRVECHPVISDNLAESEGTGDAWADCSECGHLLFVLTDPNSEPPAYCPWCGAKVVGPTTNGADAGVNDG